MLIYLMAFYFNKIRLPSSGCKIRASSNHLDKNPNTNFNQSHTEFPPHTVWEGRVKTSVVSILKTSHDLKGKLRENSEGRLRENSTPSSVLLSQTLAAFFPTCLLSGAVLLSLK